MSTRRQILVTGASGFIGHRLMQSIPVEGTDWFAWSTRTRQDLPSVPIDAVVHCAGLAHQMTEVDPSLYFKINHEKSIQLATLARAQGAKHFVYLSSSKVFGDPKAGDVLCESSECRPTDAYGESKLLAERDLLRMASEDFAVSIVRPPLVFGPGVKGNFIRLLRLADSYFPLPFGKANCERSMVFVDNLIALTAHLIQSPTTGVFHAGESYPPTVEQLVRKLRLCLGHRERLFAIPYPAIALGRKVAPKLVSRLFDGFVVSNEWTNKHLSYHPPYSFEEGILETTKWYLKEGKNKRRT